VPQNSRSRSSSPPAGTGSPGISPNSAAVSRRTCLNVDLSTIDLRQAQDAIFERLKAFSKQHNLPYRRAAFRCQRTKWGSCCATTRSISLNINIVLLPVHLQDYLLLHELTHLSHPNHSPAFWAELDRYCAGSAKRLSKELKTYPMMLIGSRQ
jgi:predicted metal-dependent hydrolase